MNNPVYRETMSYAFYLRIKIVKLNVVNIRILFKKLLANVNIVMIPA